MERREFETKKALPFAGLILAALLAACSPTAGPATPGTPAAESPATGRGPVAIVGEATSANFAVSPELFPDPTVVLYDFSDYIKGRRDVFVSELGQIQGVFTEPMFPLPGEFRVNLPIEPTGASVDLDNNGAEDRGVQAYQLAVAANYSGNSYLQQVEQLDILPSVLLDITSGDIREGSLLVYSPDDAQGFPTGIGADGKWFTADDPTAPLPQGYSVARLGADGTVTFDRSTEATINTIERAEVASPDFSQQGILESYHSLMDTLKTRYAYTDLRQLDWDQIRAQYLPDVEKADASQDSGAYFVILDQIASSIRDAHVTAIPGSNLDAILARGSYYAAFISGNLGAETFAASDPADPNSAVGDKILVLTVGADSPASKAGWVPGTEIVTIDGQPATARYETIPVRVPVGTEESARALQAQQMLYFPAGQTVSVGYRLPDSTEVRTATMTAGEYDTGYAYVPSDTQTALTYEGAGDYIRISWKTFMDPVEPKIAVLEEALTQATSGQVPGVILDLRGNSGGLVTLYMDMASYFFPADQPMPYHVTDWYYYDEAAGGLVKSYSSDNMLSAPRPDLAYTGPVVILVDNHCASACEYFSQHLQLLGRATVVGQYATEGAGGPVDVVALPDDLGFQYTMGRTTFAGTDELNLEAKGVVPDVRVPVTLETEQAKTRGEDPVLMAGIAELDRQVAEQSARLSANPWQWVSYTGATEQVQVETPENYVLTFGSAEEGAMQVKADCSNATGAYAASQGMIMLALDPLTPTTCAEGSRSEQFLTLLGSVSPAQPAKYAIADGNLQLQLADGSTVLFAPGE